MTQGNDPLTIGVVGCGNIASTYLRNASLFPGTRIVCCADINPEQAQNCADEYGLDALTFDALLARSDVELVLNLTVPRAHAEISTAALRAGKHVYTEKPLGVSIDEGRRLLDEAKRAQRLIGSAPDTFLGAAGRRARQLIDDGLIGTPVAGTAFMLGRGMEHWHPDPAFYYQPGAGPLFDMGPYYLTMLVSLLGSVARVQSLASSGQAERLITADGPLHNTRFPVETHTTVLSLLQFSSGAIVTFGTSWDVFRHTNHPIEIHGTKGSLRLPDPDTFGGTVSVSAHGAPWAHHDTRTCAYGEYNWPYDAPDRANYRMLAIADMAAAIRAGESVRASAQLALHVLDVMDSIAQAASTGRAHEVSNSTERPAPLSESAADALSV